MLRSLLLFAAFWLASLSVALAEGKWEKDVGRGWHYSDHGMNFFWVSGTLFQPVAYYWHDDFNKEWVQIDQIAFYSDAYYSSTGFVSPYAGYSRDRGGIWRLDDGRGGYDWTTDSHHRASPDRPTDSPIAIEAAAKMVKP